MLRLFLISLVLIISPYPIVDAWGKMGHEMVGNVAYQLLPDKTQSWVDGMLVNRTRTNTSTCHECTSLGMIADWADAVRYTHDYHWTAPLHYIDVRDDLIAGGCPVLLKNESGTCHFDYARDCVDDFCAAGAIANYTLHLDDHDTSLMFVTHFVGDIHQPLHSSRTSDRGGNNIHVTFNESSSISVRALNERRRKKHHDLNLHAVWDDSIIERAIHEFYDGSRVTMEQELMTIIHRANKSGDLDQWLHCGFGGSTLCTQQWGEESLMLALHYAYGNVDGTEIVDGTPLEEMYFQTRLPIVRNQLAKAAVRLAATIDARLRKESPEALKLLLKDPKSSWVQLPRLRRRA